MFFIDLHTHANYKPFAWAHNGKTVNPMSPQANHRSSLWYYDPPSLLDKVGQLLLGITKFRQANGTAAYYGNVNVMVLSLGSAEKYFFDNKYGSGIFSDLLGDFVAGFGKTRIDAIQNMTDYWKDLQNEFQFIESGEGLAVKIDNLYHTYRVAKSFDDLQRHQQENEDPKAGKTKDRPIVLSLIYSIEGMHVLDDDLSKPLVPKKVLQKVTDLKNRSCSPWFVNISHHFDNKLCGHARSLKDKVAKCTNQETNINGPISPLGQSVVKLLLDKDKGKRIFVDLKHMSISARKWYRDWRRQNSPEEIPLIISHGTCNGLPNYEGRASDFPLLGKYFITPVGDEIGGDGTFKEQNSINFYDDEIAELVASNGIMGMQLDERRLANTEGMDRVKHSIWRHKIMHYRSELVWNQLRYMAEMLDSKGLFGWGHIAIGSDYDGIVDPLNSFWTIEQYDSLAQYIERHAFSYFNDYPDNLKNSFNKISPDELIERLFRRNAWDFFKRWF